MFTHTIETNQASLGTKVFYGNLIVMLLNIVIFSILYYSLFDAPNVEEYKTLSKEGVKVYFGVVPLISFGLYKGFKKSASK